MIKYIGYQSIVFGEVIFDICYFCLFLGFLGQKRMRMRELVYMKTKKDEGFDMF